MYMPYIVYICAIIYHLAYFIMSTMDLAVIQTAMSLRKLQISFQYDPINVYKVYRLLCVLIIINSSAHI